ncbi:MAG: FkbM family methyltransferase [bacterium]
MTIKSYLVQYVLPIINKFSGLVSLKVVTVGTPNRDFTAFFKHLKRMGIEFKSVIDVGVGNGSPTIYQSIPNAQFYLVEPVPAAKPLLKKLEKEIGAKIYNVAAGKEDGSIEFYVHEDVTGSSSYRQIEGEFMDGEKVEVPVRRLDRLIEQKLVRPSLLKIDTQGSELEVLEGALGIIDEIDVLIIETSFHEFRQGAPEFHDIVFKMIELGFRTYEVLEGHYRSSDGALAQVDLVFVKEDSVFRDNKAFFTRDQARQYLDSGQIK